MRQREVIFRMGSLPSRRTGHTARADPSHGTITFIDADCARITPETSTLRGAMTFDSCRAKPSESRPSKPSEPVRASVVTATKPLPQAPQPSVRRNHSTMLLGLLPTWLGG